MEVRTLTAAMVVGMTVAGTTTGATIQSSPDGYAVRAMGNVTLKDRVSVGSNVAAGGSLNVGFDSVISGMAQYGTTLIQKDRAMAHGGFVQASGAFEQITDPTMPAYNSNSVSPYYDQTVSLAAGSYGNLSAKDRSTVNLSSGTYAFDSVSINTDVRFNVDTSAGDVYIYTNQGFTGGDRFVLNNTGGGSVFLVVDGYANFKNDVTLQGVQVFGTGGEGVRFGDRASITGSVYSDADVYVGFDSGFTFSPASVAVPNVGASATLMAAGGLCLRRRRSLAASA